MPVFIFQIQDKTWQLSTSRKNIIIYILYTLYIKKEYYHCPSMSTLSLRVIQLKYHPLHRFTFDVKQYSEGIDMRLFWIIVLSIIHFRRRLWLARRRRGGCGGIKRGGDVTSSCFTESNTNTIWQIEPRYNQWSHAVLKYNRKKNPANLTVKEIYKLYP